MCPLDRVLTYKNLIYLLNLQFYCVNTSYPMDNSNSNSNWTFIALNLPKQEDSKAQQNKKQLNNYRFVGG